MERESDYPNVFPLIAAAAWLTVPIAWSIGADFEGNVLTLLGWVALVVAGVFSLLAMLGITSAHNRGPMVKTGIAVQALGMVATVVVFWAVPLWAGLYAIAMVLYAIRLPQVRRATLIVAGAMAAAVVAFFVLTALQVGTPDSYGDYPVAWATSYFLATIGGAVGNFVLSRREVSPKSNIPAAV